MCGGGVQQSSCLVNGVKIHPEAPVTTPTPFFPLRLYLSIYYSHLSSSLRSWHPSPPPSSSCLAGARQQQSRGDHTKPRQSAEYQAPYRESANTATRGTLTLNPPPPPPPPQHTPLPTHSTRCSSAYSQKRPAAAERARQLSRVISLNPSLTPHQHAPATLAPAN